MRTFKNPVLPGFHPDPSVCRAGDDYYLVTSSFEYFPGVPVYHSKNLAEWELIGYALTRPSQLDLTRAKSSQGIFAPTIRFHRGTFIVVTTNMTIERGFYVTTDDPRGAWSEPVYIQEQGFTMDPSLLFDDDGKVYYTRHGGGRHGGVFQAEIDLATGRLHEPARPIWAGTGGIWPEAPHLYKIRGYYYLMIAEGGTSYDHAVTIARSKTPWGPFEACPHNPILTHRHDRTLPIQATGHADLVECPDGSWWLVLLGIRPWDGAHHHLGRETFLAPVHWDDRGWPVVNQGRPIEATSSAAGLPGGASGGRLMAYGARPMRDDFAGATLDLAWNFLRNPDRSQRSLEARPGWLRLFASAATLDDEAPASFVGRRQLHAACRVTSLLEFAPIASGEAGLVVRADERNHYVLALSLAERGLRVLLRSRVQGASTTIAELGWSEPRAELCIEACPSHYEFFARAAGGALCSLGRLPTEALSSEVTGGFTGVYVGMFVTGGTQAAPADFDYFEYTPLEASA